MLDFSKFSREKSGIFLRTMENDFLSYFSNVGCVVHKPAPVTSGIDPTVRFIGSHTSVLKPYIANGQVPSGGYVMSQECFKARNPVLLLDDTQVHSFASVYSAFGILAPYQKLEAMSNLLERYFREKIGIEGVELVASVSSKDNDLKNALKASCTVEVDTLPERKYEHQFGMDDVTGRCAVVSFRNGQNTISNSVVIAMEKEGKPSFVEITISPMLIMKQLAGLEHIQDCYPVPEIPGVEEGTKRKLEDCIIATTLLYREGLRPSNKHNRNRLLSQYVQILGYLCKNNGISHEALQHTIGCYENRKFMSSPKAALDIVSDVAKLNGEITTVKLKEVVEERIKRQYA